MSAPNLSEPPRKGLRRVVPATTPAQVLVGAMSLMVVVGVLWILWGSPEPGQGAGLGGLAVLIAAAITFYGGERGRRQDAEANSRSHTLESTRDLRARFTVGAAQLTDSAATVRLAGVYSLASLADDWHGAGFDTERQACINLLCAYLRNDTTNLDMLEAQISDTAWLSNAQILQQEEQRVRDAIVSTIRNHLSRSAKSSEPSWVGANFDLSVAHLDHVDFSNCHFAGETRFAAAHLTGANFKGSRLPAANFDWAYMTEANLFDADLHGARLVGTHLDGANLMSANFTNAILDKAKMQGAVCGATDFRHAHLIEADLSGAELDYAVLANTRMAGAKLRRTSLTMTDFQGADLRNGTDLTGASGFGSGGVGHIQYDATATWPDGGQLAPNMVTAPAEKIEPPPERQ